MKHLARLLSLLVLVSAGFFFTNCGGGGGGEGKSEQEIAFDKLKGTWIVTSVQGPGTTDWSTEFDNGELGLAFNTFGEDAVYDYTFNVVGGVTTSPWPDLGEWRFGSTPANTIIRLDPDDDDVTMTYTVTDNTLEIEFDYDGSGFTIPGRIQSVDGPWVFSFEK